MSLPAEYIPRDAICISYQPKGGTARNYYVWPKYPVWIWHALGRTESAATEQEASIAARRWINDAQ